ncbi:MAG: hypothetical protein HYY13_02295 [Nitrospirae bacterium]|nr:hypothetical protein [Nitrospirota bacterium]
MVVWCGISLWGLSTALAAEVTIDGTVSTVQGSHLGGSPMVVFTDDSTGYVFYRDSGGTCVYSKTTNGGAGWGAAQTVDGQTDCIGIGVWYDRWTPGDTTGNYIHIVTWDSGSGALWYTRLNTSGDSLSSTVNASSNSGQTATLSAGSSEGAITKATDGDLYMGTISLADSFVVRCANGSDCTVGTNWLEAGTNPFTPQNAWPLLMPLAGGKVMAIDYDPYTGVLQSNVFDDSSGTWDGAWADIDLAPSANTTYDGGFGATVDRETNEIYLAYCADNSTLGTNDDIRTAIYSGGVWTARTNALTDDAKGITSVKIALDEDKKDVYVVYTARTTPGTATTANVYWKRSSDGMLTWGGENGPINTGSEDMFGVTINILSTERIFVGWYEATPDGLYGDSVVDLAPPTSKYWIGSTGGNCGDNARWSTSSGGANNTTAPGADDVAVFDGGGTGNCSLTSNASVRGLEIKSGYTGAVTQDTGVTLTVGASDFKQSAGTFVGGNSTFDVNGDFTLSGGTFTSGSGSLALSRTVSISGSPTFNHNSGTVTFDGTINQAVTTGGVALNNVTVNATGASGLDRVSVSGALAVNGTLTITDGILVQTTANVTAGTVSIGSSGEWQNSSTGDVSLGSGGVSNSGRILFDGGGGGCLGGDPIQIRSTSSGTQRSWSGSGVFAIQDVDVQDQAGGASIRTRHSTNTGNNGPNWTFDSACVVAIDSAADSTQSKHSGTSPTTVFTTDQVGYAFYADSGQECVYRKTTDGGSTWGAPIRVDSVNVADCARIAVWYDQWTPGDNSGTKIHISTFDYNDIFYTRLDTSGDSLTSTVNASGAGQGGTFSQGDFHSITKGSDGDVYMGIPDDSDGFVLKCANGADCTNAANWVEAGANPFNLTNDWLILMPLPNANILAIYWDRPADTIESKVYHDSTDSWDGAWTTVRAGTSDNSVYTAHFGATVDRRTNDIYLGWAGDLGGIGNGSDDFETAIYSEGAWTRKSDVFTDTGLGPTGAKIAFDENSKDVYAIYTAWTNPPDPTTANVYWRKSTDGMTTWGPEQGPVNMISGDLYGAKMNILSGDRIFVSWFVVTDNDLLGATLADLTPPTTKYWIAGSAGNFGDNTRWSLSSGGANNTTAPGSNDLATFDGGGTGNCAMAANASVYGIDINSGYTGAITQNSGVTLAVGMGGYDQAAGTFAGGNSTIDINEDFILSGGTFTSTTGNMSVAWFLTVSGGPTFTANGGTVTLDGQVRDQKVTTNSISFNNLTLNQSGWAGLDDVTISGTLDVNGTLTLTDGDLDLDTNDPAVNTAGNVTVMSGGSVTAGSGTWTFDGSGTSTFSPNGQNVGAVTADGTAKTVNLGGTVTISTLTIGSDDLFDLSGYALTATSLVNNGTLRLQGGEVVSITTFDTDSGTTEYNGSGTYTSLAAGSTYYNLTVNGTASWTQATALTVNNLLSVTAGTLKQMVGNYTVGGLSMGSAGIYRNQSTGDLTIGAGNVTNNGTIWLDGSGAGCGGTDDILVRSSASPTQRTWGGSGSVTMYDVDVMDQAGAASITVGSGTNSGNNGGNWTINTTCGTTMYWISGGAANFNTVGNWSNSSGGASNGTTPGTLDTATFDGNGLGNCTLTANVDVTGFNVVSGYSGTITQNSGVTMTLGTGGYTQAAGTFSGGDSAITSSGPFALSNAGTSFTSTSGTLSVLRGFTIVGSPGPTFSANGGTVLLNGVTDQTFRTNSKPFNNVTLNNTGGSATGSQTNPDALTAASLAYPGGGSNVVFVTASTGYLFYRDDTLDCVYRKTNDGGVSWGSKVVVDAQTDCYSIDVWYDRWTPGDTTGNYIHVATMDGADVYYTRLDTATDGLTTTVNASWTAQGGSFSAGATFVSMVRGTDGDLYIGIQNTSDSFVIKCANGADCTNQANWSEAGTNPFDLQNDYLILMPLAGGDILAIVWDISANTVRSKVYTDGTNSWSGSWTNIDASADENNTYDAGFGATVNPTNNDVYLAYTANVATIGSNDDDIRTATYSGGSWTLNTDVVTNSLKGITAAKIARDWGNADLYVVYTARTTPGTASTSNVYWKKSTDGMSTWGAEMGPLNAVSGDYYPRVNILSSQRLYVAWVSNVPDYPLYGNTVGPANNLVTLNGALDVNGNLTVTDGCLDLMSNNVNANLAGNVNIQTAGELRQGTGTVTLDGAADQSFGTNGVAFELLTINNTGAAGNDDIVVSGNLDVNKLFTVTDGDLDLAVSNPNVSTFANVSIAAAGSVTPGGGTWTFDGNGAVTLSPNGQSLGKVTVDGSAITLTLSGGALTSTTLAIGGDDKLVLAGNNLTVTTLANTGTLQLYGSEALTITTPDSDSGTVEYKGDGDGAVETWTIADFVAGTDYYILTINDVNATKDNFQLGAALYVVGTITVSTGTVTQGANNVTTGGLSLASGTTWTNTSTGDLTVGGGGVSNGGSMTLDAGGGGCGGADDILIRSTVSGTNRNWLGSGTFTVYDVDVKDQDTVGITINADSSTNSGNNGSGWSFSSNCPVTKYWIGAGAGTFGDNTRWSLSSGGANNTTAPGTDDTATFDGGGTGNCTLAASASVRGVDINSGYTGTITQNSTVTLTVGVNHFDQAAGTFTGGNSAIDVNGNFVLSGGTFTSTSGTLSIEKNMTVSGAPTFSANGGTITLDGTRVQTVTTNAVTFNHLTINNTGTDVTSSQAAVDSNVNSTDGIHQGTSPTVVFTSANVGYAFYTDSTGICAYSKTTDGGTTWGAAVTVDPQADCVAVAAWYDRWTPGDSAGNYIHIVTIDSGSDDLWYERLDTTTDLVTTPVNATGANQGGSFSSTSGAVPTITKGADGDLYMGINDDSDAFVIKCPTGSDCTQASNWTEAGSGVLAVGDYFIQLVPLANNNIVVIRHHPGSDRLASKVYADSTDTWDAGWTSIDLSVTDNTTYVGTFGAAYDKSTDKIYLAYAADIVALGADDDIRTAVYSNGNWTAKTNVLTNDSKGVTGAKIAVDESTGDVYVVYTARTTPGTASTGNVYWKRSTDGMTTWTNEQGPINTSPTDLYGVRINLSSSARLYATAVDGTNDDLYGRTIGPSRDEVVISGNLDVNGNLTLTDGNLDLGMYNPNVNTAGSVIIQTNGSVTKGTGTWTFDGSGTSTLTGNGQNLGTVTVDGASKTVNLGGTVAFGTLTIGADDTFGLAGFNVTIATLANNGTLQLQGGETVTITTFDTDSGTTTYSGGSTYASLAAGNAYYNLAFNGAGMWTPAANLTVNGTLTVTSGTFKQTTANVTAAGISVGSSGIYRNESTGDITIGVSSVTVNGAMVLDGNGAGCGSVDDILIRSSASPTQRTWSGTGSVTAYDVDVMDQAGTLTITAGSSTDSLNNGANWTISAGCGTTMYWISGSASNFATVGNWSNSSGGASNGTTPSSIDTATFDGNGLGACNIAANLNVRGINIVSGYTGTITQNAGMTLAVGDTNYAQADGTFNAGNSSFTSTGTFTLTGGTFNMGAGTLDSTGAMTIGGGSGTATFNTGGSSGTLVANADVTVSQRGVFQMAGASTLRLADTSTFQASYAASNPGKFKASSASATVTKTAPGSGGFRFRIYGEVDITGLAFSYGSGNGLQVGDGTNTPTITKLEGITFSNINAAAGARHMTVKVATLIAKSPDIYWGAVGAGQYNLRFEDNNGSTDTYLCVEDISDVANGPGRGSSKEQEVNGATINWLQSCASDTAGDIGGGFPTLAYDWNTYAPYAVYVGFKNVGGAGTADRIYVRDTAGNPLYTYDIADADGDLLGTPIWDTKDEASFNPDCDLNNDGDTTDTGLHVLYVATGKADPGSVGKVFLLTDDSVSQALEVPAAGCAWNTPYSDGGSAVDEITSPLIYDANNLYFGGENTSDAARIFGIQISDKTLPKNVGAASRVHTAPAWKDFSGTVYLYVGSRQSPGCPGTGTAHIYRVNTTGAGSVETDNSASALHNVNGLTTLLGGRIHVGDDGGRMHGLDNASGLANLGSYPYRDTTNHSVANLDNCVYPITAAPYVKWGNWRVEYGDADGHFYVLDTTPAAVTGYPFRPGGSTSAFTNGGLLISGVMVVGNANGKVYYIDESAANVIQTYDFGSGVTIGQVGYNSGQQKFMIGTSDGGLYFLNKVNDPTP